MLFVITIRELLATITGIIRTEDGNPALGAVVRAFDIDLRSEQLLGETVIEETSGRYEISYSDKQYRRAGKKSDKIALSMSRGFSPSLT